MYNLYSFFTNVLLHNADVSFVCSSHSAFIVLCVFFLFVFDSLDEDDVFEMMCKYDGVMCFYLCLFSSLLCKQ